MSKRLLILLSVLSILIISTSFVYAQNTENISYHLVEKGTDYNIGGITLNEDYDFYVIDGGNTNNLLVLNEYLDIPILGIKDRAFNESNNLEELDLSNATNLKVIGDYAFKDTINLKSNIIFPSKLETIGTSAFRGSGITSIDFDSTSTLLTIKENAFSASNISNSLNLPNSLLKIEQSAFTNTNIKSVTFGNKLTYIGAYAFDKTNLEGELIFNADLSFIGDHAFRQNDLSKISLANSKVERILPLTFGLNPNLEEIVFSKDLKVIETDAFLNSDSLTKLTFLGTNQIEFKNNSFNFNTLRKVLVSSQSQLDYLSSLELFSEEILELTDEFTSYQVTFESNGGTPLENIQVFSGNKITGITTPIKEGYDFIGWFLDEDFKTSFNLDNDTVNEDITLYAKWEKSLEKYTVSFETNGGSSLDSIQVSSNSLIEKPTDPNRKGYKFIGWFIDENFETPFNFDSDTINEDITLYAKWEQTIKEDNSTLLIVSISTVAVLIIKRKK